MNQRALREEYRIDRGQDRGRHGDFGVGYGLRQPKEAEQGERSGQQHGGSGHQRREPRDLPPQRQVGHHQRRVSVGDGGMRNQASGQQQIARRRNVVAGLVPEIRQAQQGRVQRHERRKGQNKYERGMRPARGLVIEGQEWVSRVDIKNYKSRNGGRASCRTGRAERSSSSQCTGPGAIIRGSSLISPNVLS